MHLLSGSTQAFSFERIGKLKYKTKVNGQAIVDKYVSVHWVMIYKVLCTGWKLDKPQMHPKSSELRESTAITGHGIP